MLEALNCCRVLMGWRVRAFIRLNGCHSPLLCLIEKGRIQTGSDADIVIFDAKTVFVNAVYGDPC
jgi:N-acyl-D-aspartate/D-glutamate deacylase